jgi:hypothetical protein
VGVNIADFRGMRKRDSFQFFSRIYWLEPEEGSKSLMNTIPFATNESVSSRREDSLGSETERKFKASVAGI